jgi:hypothetical protein
MTQQQLFKRERSKAFLLYAQGKIDRCSLGRILSGRGLFWRGEVLYFGRDWQGRLGWYHGEYVG